MYPYICIYLLATAIFAGIVLVYGNKKKKKMATVKQGKGFHKMAKNIKKLCFRLIFIRSYCRLELFFFTGDVKFCKQSTF